MQTIQKQLNEYTGRKNRTAKVLEFLTKHGIAYQNITDDYGYFRVRINNTMEQYEDIYYSDYDKM